MRKAILIVVTLLFAVNASAQLFPAPPEPRQFAPAAGKYSRIFVVDPANGADTNTCTSFANPCKTIAAAYAKTTSGRNDTVLFVGGATGDTLAETLTWSNSYTHLVGVGCEQPGMGNRCRITGGATVDLPVVITLSGSGCIFKNLQISNWADADVDSGALVVSGSRNVLENVFVAGMGHQTPAARAGSYSVKVTGSENIFKNFTIGLDTVIRAAANAELHVSGERNRFYDGDIRSYSETAGKFLVKIDNSGADLRDTIFKNVIFFNYTVNWATGITDAIDMPAGGNTHFVILQNCQLVGVGTGWADTVTHVYSDSPAPNAGFGVSVTPTT